MDRSGADTVWPRLPRGPDLSRFLDEDLLRLRRGDKPQRARGLRRADPRCQRGGARAQESSSASARTPSSEYGNAGFRAGEPKGSANRLGVQLKPLLRRSPRSTSDTRRADPLRIPGAQRRFWPQSAIGDNADSALRASAVSSFEGSFSHDVTLHDRRQCGCDPQCLDTARVTAAAVTTNGLQSCCSPPGPFPDPAGLRPESISLVRWNIQL